MPSPNFEKFLDKFNETALRPFLANAKEKLDEQFNSVPTSMITQIVADAYTQLQSVNTESVLNRALDPAKVETAVNSLKAQLQDPQASLQVAQSLKQVLAVTSSEKFEETLLKATQNAPLEQRFAMQLLAAQLAPKIDEIKSSSVEDVAQRIRDFGSRLSADDVNQQLGMVKQFGPQSFASQQQDALSRLPAPEAVADAMKALGNAASQALDNASKASTFAETVAHLKQFVQDASGIVPPAPGQDTGPQAPIVEKPKKLPRPKKGKGGGFKL